MTQNINTDIHVYIQGIHYYSTFLDDDPDMEEVLVARCEKQLPIKSDSLLSCRIPALCDERYGNFLLSW